MSRRAGGARARLAAAALLAVVAVAGCGGSDDGLPDDPGYVAGDGAIVQFDAARRGEPVELAGTTAAGERLDLADLRGSVVVLNVWYADCPPCRKEAPVLQQVSQDYADRGVRFVGLNTRNDSVEAVEAFQTTFGVTYPSIRDTDGKGLNALRGSAAPNATPTTLVLDPEGRVAASVSGEVRASTLTGLLDDVLAEGGTASAAPSPAAGAAAPGAAGGSAG